MSLWTAEQVLAATGGEGPGGWTAEGVSIDTRTLVPGDLFVALRGPNNDAHLFLAEAFARGAAAALVEREPPQPMPGPLVRVAGTQPALEALGRAARARTGAAVCALTGSVGKTGTKEALRHVLAAQAPTHASVASYNNQWGVPLSLARMPVESHFAVFEIGMNHPGEIRSLVRQVRPQVAIVTWVAAAHLAFFADERAIADAKAEIFEALPPPSVAVLPRDNPHFERLVERAREAGVDRIVGFGAADDSEWRLARCELGADGSRVVADTPVGRLDYVLPVAGRHWVDNSLAVLAAVDALGGDAIAAADALAGFVLPAGRGRRVILPTAGGTALLLDESYNANPASMRAALATLGLLPGRRIAVLGDMAELGEAAPELHAGLVEAIERAGVDKVYLCGPLMQHLWAALPPERRGAYAASADALVSSLRPELRAGDVVMVKGSLVSGMRRLVEALAEPAIETEA